MSLVFADAKQINPVDENNSDEFYYVEAIKLTGQTGPGYRFLIRTTEQIPQNEATEKTENEHLLPVKVDESSPQYLKDILNVADYILAQGVPVTDNLARRFAYKWIESK